MHTAISYGICVSHLMPTGAGHAATHFTTPKAAGHCLDICSILDASTAIILYENRSSSDRYYRCPLALAHR
jgi:hypothetical protein